MTMVNALWIFWGKTQKEHGKRYVYVFAESNQNNHMTPTLYDFTHFDTFPLQFRPMTLKTKTNLKFSLIQDSI